MIEVIIQISRLEYIFLQHNHIKKHFWEAQEIKSSMDIMNFINGWKNAENGCVPSKTSANGVKGDTNSRVKWSRGSATT